MATCSVVEVLAASVFSGPDSEMDSVLLSSDLGSRARMDGGVATSKSRDGCTLDKTNGSLKELVGHNLPGPFVNVCLLGF